MYTRDVTNWRTMFDVPICDVTNTESDPKINNTQGNT